MTAQRSGFWSRPTWVRPSVASWSDKTSWQRRAQTGSEIEPSGFHAHVWYFEKLTFVSQPTLVLGGAVAHHRDSDANIAVAAARPLFRCMLAGILSRCG